MAELQTFDADLLDKLSLQTQIHQNAYSINFVTAGVIQPYSERQNGVNPYDGVIICDTSGLLNGIELRAAVVTLLFELNNKSNNFKNYEPFDIGTLTINKSTEEGKKYIDVVFGDRELKSGDPVKTFFMENPNWNPEDARTATLTLAVLGLWGCSDNIDFSATYRRIDDGKIDTVESAVKKTNSLKYQTVEDKQPQSFIIPNLPHSI